MTVDISLGQILSTTLLGLITFFVKGTRTEIANLRTDIKEERDARGDIENRLSAVEARCQERHAT